MTTRSRRTLAAVLAGVLLVAMITADVVTLTKSKSNFDNANRVLTQAAKDIKRDQQSSTTVPPSTTTSTASPAAP